MLLAALAVSPDCPLKSSKVEGAVAAISAFAAPRCGVVSPWGERLINPRKIRADDDESSLVFIQ